jgi:demethylmenaquinone methyltransferase/2-methoxy-6-polyprenyl-1,4-benzoquinol methylase
MSEKDKQTDTTHFGFRQVPTGEKAKMVGEVFTSVADRYDLMNDLMSMGVHRLWKRHFVQSSGIRPGDQVLDLAGGTGDITALMNKRVGPEGRIILADINGAMLENGRDRLLDEGFSGNVGYAQVNAESLPFASNTFNAVTMAFGLRNVTEKQAALDSIFRVLKPGGRVLVLEFSRLKADALRPLYDWYSFKVLPRLGAFVADDADSYQYLA